MIATGVVAKTSGSQKVNNLCGSSPINGENMNLYKSAALCLGLCIAHGQVFAYMQSTMQQDKPVDRLEVIYETQAIADNVWSGLTSEFVSMYEAGNYAQASALAKQAYDMALANFGRQHINTADSMLKLGIINETLGNYDVAKQHMTEAMEILVQELGPSHEDVAIVLTNLANLYFEQNQPEQSELHHKKALEIRMRTLGENDPAVAQSMYNLAVLYDDLTKYEQAAELYESALKIWNASYGAVHPYVANALNNLANVYMVMEHYEDAVELHKHSLAVRRSLYGDNHAEVARSLINLGALYVKQSAYDKAEPMYVEAVKVAENLFGPQHPQVAMLLYSLANIYHIQGRLAKAESQTLDKNAPSAEDITNAAQATKVSVAQPGQARLEKSAQTKFKQAVPLYERALKILDSSMGGQHPAVTAMINELAMLYKSIGDTTNAQKMQARLSSIH